MSFGLFSTLQKTKIGNILTTKRELETARRTLLDAERNVDFFRDKVVAADDLTDIAQLIEEKLTYMQA